MLCPQGKQHGQAQVTLPPAPQPCLLAQKPLVPTNKQATQPSILALDLGKHQHLAGALHLALTPQCLGKRQVPGAQAN